MFQFSIRFSEEEDDEETNLVSTNFGVLSLSTKKKMIDEVPESLTQTSN